MILATIKHRVPEDEPEKERVGLFLDMDLSILGEQKEVYEDYCQRVRLEYAHVPDADFVKGRIAVLKHLMRSDSTIYFTKIG